MPHFSEEEAQRIFARAAERQHDADDAPAGFSLDELTEIGAAAGLRPEHIAAAVSEVRTERPSGRAPARFLGVDLEPRAVRVLPTPLTDKLWGQLVSQVRPVFQTTGVTSEVGATREWNGTNERGGLSNLRMTAEPVAGGTRVVLETSRASEARQTWGAAVGFSVPALLGAALGIAMGEPEVFVLVALFLAMAVLFPAGYRLAFRRWSARRQREFDALLDRFELTARDAAGEPEATLRPTAHRPTAHRDASPTAPGAAPLDLAPLDLDELGEPDDATGQARARRQRS